ncbi:MAG TPA: M56 family metallopeptidase, partial [Puia sp.]|nr:M56 family metallopeptidase [Puia sp.]
RAPFSFFSNLFWQQGADVDDPVHRRILDHELSHIRGRHTYDTLFAQLVAAVFWINPFYWLIRRELAMVHEFIADEASLAAGDSEGFAQMLLQAYDDGRYLDPSHRFFHSPIKRRLTMITTNRRSARWGMLLALPALMAVMTLSCSKEDAASAQKTPPLPPPPPAQGQVFKVKLLKDSLYRQIKADVDRRVMNVYYVTVVGKNAKRLTYSLSSKEDLDNVSRGVLIKGVFVQKMQKPVIVTDKQE